MLTKSFSAKVKAVAGEKDSGLDEGQFEAIVSVFGNVDSQGDMVVKGAFADDLKTWAESGDPIPIVWAHQWQDPFAHIGYVLEASETAEGLHIKGQLDIEGDDPTAQKVYRLLKSRRVKQFSFAYDVIDGASVKSGEDTVYELRKLKTYEVGPCLVGANQETELLAVKAAQLAKSGRVISAKNLDALKRAHEAIGQVISAADVSEDEEKAATIAVQTSTDTARQAEGSTGKSESEALEDAQEAKSARDRKARAFLARISLQTIS